MKKLVILVLIFILTLTGCAEKEIRYIYEGFDYSKTKVARTVEPDYKVGVYSVREYDRQGRIVRITNYNTDRSGDTPESIEDYRYTDGGLCVERIDYNQNVFYYLVYDEDMQIIQDHTYDYDPVTKVYSLVGWGEYEYDNQRRIIKSVHYNSKNVEESSIVSTVSDDGFISDTSYYHKGIISRKEVFSQKYGLTSIIEYNIDGSEKNRDDIEFTDTEDGFYASKSTFYENGIVSRIHLFNRDSTIACAQTYTDGKLAEKWDYFYTAADGWEGILYYDGNGNLLKKQVFYYGENGQYTGAVTYDKDGIFLEGSEEFSE